MSSNYTTVDYETVIANYTPRAVRSEPRGHITDFARGYVRALNIIPDNTSRDALHNTLDCVSKFAAWVWMSYGVVAVEAIFHPDIAGNYSPAGDGAKLSPSIARTQRSLLCCAAEVINDGWNPDYQYPISYEPILEPYDSRACDRMWDWIESQSTAARRRNFTTVLALTLGTGLRAGEICTLCGRDVCVDGDGVLLFPRGYRGTDPREVPLLKSYIKVLQPVTMATGPEDYLSRPGRDNENTSQLSAYLHQVAPSTSPDMVPGTHRPCNTWIIDRIAVGASAGMLCAAAELKPSH